MLESSFKKQIMMPFIEIFGPSDSKKFKTEMCNL